MPELPDVEIYKKEAEKAKNATVIDVEIADGSFVDVSKYEFEKDIIGKSLKNIERRGKYLFLKTKNNHALVMHFGMTGELKYLSEDKDGLKYDKCILVLNNKHKLHYSTKRKLGFIEITEDIDKYINEIALGPDVLDLDRNAFFEKIHEKNSMIKSALTDQELMSGIGNDYGDEILFQAKTHPGKKTNDLTDDEIGKIYDLIREIIGKAIELKADVSKFPDYFLLPHRDAGEPCPKCDGEIEKIKISGRTGYYCPSCQKK